MAHLGKWISENSWRDELITFVLFELIDQTHLIVSFFASEQKQKIFKNNILLVHLSLNVAYKGIC